jgi:hypothetical protein
MPWQSQAQATKDEAHEVQPKAAEGGGCRRWPPSASPSCKLPANAGLTDPAGQAAEQGAGRCNQTPRLGPLSSVTGIREGRRR